MLPASALYAWAALDLGLPYINFTPSLGASFPAAEELAEQRGAVYGGKDGKTGETLLKTVLAPMFALRNWRILSWVGHNIFGNRDGQVLDDPANKASKIQTKDQVISRSSATSRRRTSPSSTSNRWTTGRRPGTTSTSAASSASR